MQLGFASAILPDLDRNEVLAFAREGNFTCVELMCWPKGAAERRYAGVTHIEVETVDDEAAKRIRDEAASAGVRISGLGYYPNALSPDPAEAEAAVAHIQKVIEASARLGVGLVNTFVGRDWTKSVDENWPRFLDTWRPLIAF
ncbi:MAG TPA: TIM barrel protein, partial [Armatimonadota bacterium]|nr:TIM barrel protein [Armatimonadota bacterium]